MYRGREGRVEGDRRPSAMLHVSVWRQGRWGAGTGPHLPCRNVFNLKAAMCPDYQPRTRKPQTLRDLLVLGETELSWKGTNLSQCRKCWAKPGSSSPKRGSEMSHPQNPPKSRVCAHLGEDVNTSGNGLRDSTFSGHCRRPQAENLWSKPFQGAANTFSKDKRQKNLG